MLGVDLQAFWVFRNTTGSEQGKSERKTEWKVCIESRNTQRGGGGSEEAHANVFVY